MLKHIASLALAVLSMGAVGAASADDKPYKEGPVTDVAFIRVKPGKMLDYIAHLGGTYRQELEAEKKAGLVTDYRVYEVAPRRPEDPNLILTITYPNYATLDRVTDFEAITAKVEGSVKASDKAFGERGSIRDVLGSELVRELILK